MLAISVSVETEVFFGLTSLPAAVTGLGGALWVPPLGLVQPAPSTCTVLMNSLAGLPKPVFLERLAEYGVPAFRQSADELSNEAANA